VADLRLLNLPEMPAVASCAMGGAMSLLLERAVTNTLCSCLSRECWEPYERWAPYETDLRRCLSKAVPFDITNVAEYFYLGTRQEVWNYREDFPHPVPPFNRLWMEWKPPKQFNLGGKRVDSTLEVDRMGALVETKEPPKDADSTIKYAVAMLLIMEPRGATDYLLVGPYMEFFIDRDFNMAGFPGPDFGQVKFFFPATDAQKFDAIYSGEARGAIPKSYRSSFFPVMLALSFLNCRNVHVAQKTAPPKLVAKHVKKGHPLNFTSHRIIEIQPIKRASGEASGEKGYSRQAAAIMRGHFKDYREGKGLFGRYKGLYWWDQQLRGDITAEYRFANSTGKVLQTRESQ
jgi:hypothetical protein